MSNNPWVIRQDENAWEQTVQADQLGSHSIRNSSQPGMGDAYSDDEKRGAQSETKGEGIAKNTTNGSSSLDNPIANRLETNPFLSRKKDESQTSAQNVSFSRLRLDDTNNNPWQPEQGPLNPLSASPARHATSSLLDDNEGNAWAENTKRPASTSPVLVSLPSEGESPSWDKSPLKRDERAPTPPLKFSEELTHELNIWDDAGSSSKGKAKFTSTAGTAPSSVSDTGHFTSDTTPAETADSAPPPEEKAKSSSWRPSRQPVDGKSETYQVKNIRWSEASIPGVTRVSPILVQNANGPCPLVALVNALTLTTPADTPETPLVQVLRSREQVSLNLLLDAVFDELMSPRRTSSDDALPDVSDLYAFLQSLHTGMNVNPRFIPTESMVNAYKRTSLTHLHPTERGELIPGTFESTAEMSLYATFSIPLIHGWLPLRTEPAYEALERRAPSYEDAQNLLFREEELEMKLSDAESGLTESEQQLFQDIMLIKEFLEVSATQLTPWGIEVISKAIRPGTFAILFRNDHFSTLYCHPETKQLLTLVTDAGYKTHDEIVWETLSDVQGGQTEFLSGKFQVVDPCGTASSAGAGGFTQNGDSEWTTVQGKRGKSRTDEEVVGSQSTEQEDRDLALALQLQEEEEERHRADEARRRRESLLSEQFIEQQAQQPTPVNRSGRSPRGDPRGGGMARGRGGFVPGRTSSQSAPTTSATNVQARPAQQVVRSLIPPQRQGVTRAADESAEDAPPSYEQSAHDPTYQPPEGHPSHAGALPSISRQDTRTGSMASPMGQRLPGQPTGRRPLVNSSGMIPGGGSGQSPSRERDCVVM